MVLTNYNFSCPLYPDKPGRCDTILAVKRCAAAISLIGCLFVAIMIWLFGKYQYFVQRMILALTLSAFFGSISYIMGDIYPAGAFCSFQAFMMSYFDWATLLWVCCITFNLFWTVQKLESKYSFEKWYHLFSWGVPLIWAAVPFIGSHYGPAGVWCWIDDKSVSWRFGVWYIPMYLLSFTMLATYIFIIVKVYRKASEWGGTYNAEEETDKIILRQEVKQLLAYPLIYLSLSICPFIFRIHNAANHHKETNYTLIILSVITAPLQGAVNSLAFSIDRETFKRLSWTQIKIAFLSKFGTSTQVIHDYEVEK